MSKSNDPNTRGSVLAVAVTNVTNVPAGISRPLNETISVATRQMIATVGFTRMTSSTASAA
jgi:hypothetical protein